MKKWSIVAFVLIAIALAWASTAIMPEPRARAYPGYPTQPAGGFSSTGGTYSMSAGLVLDDAASPLSPLFSLRASDNSTVYFEVSKAVSGVRMYDYNHTGVIGVDDVVGINLQWNTNVLSVGPNGPSFGGNFVVNNGTAPVFSSTAPTISSGFGSTPSIVASNGTAAFEVNVGGGGTASSGVIGLPATTNKWVCNCRDITTVSSSVFLCKQTAAASTTTATIANFNTAGAATAWAANDHLLVDCTGY